MDRHRPLKKKIKGGGLNQGQIRVADSVNAPKLDYPVFCFKHLINGYKLDICTNEQKSFFVSKLVKMAQQTWQTLMTADHKSGAGFELLPKSQIKGTLPSIITEDVSKVYVMRFNGTSYRMIGHRSDEIYHITHIDVNLSAYKH